MIDTDEHPIVISILYDALFLSLGSILRNIIRKYVSRQHQTYWLDLVTTFSVLACSLENGHIRQRYGYGAYIAVIYILSTWYSMTLDGSHPNLLSNVVAFAQGRYDLTRVLWLTTAQVFGAWLSYQGASTFWNLGLCVNHRSRAAAVDCDTDLNVSVPLGVLIESSGTAFDVVLSLCMFSSSPLIEMAVKCLILCLLTAAAVHLTGAYLNPINASNQTIGCTGTSLSNHFIVYWVGPCVSAYITSLAIQRLKEFLHPEMDLDSDHIMDKKTTNRNLDRKKKKADVNEDSNSVKDDDKTNSKTMATKVSACDKVMNRKANSNLDRKEKKIDVNEDSNAVKNDDKTNSKTMATKVSACDKVMNRKTTNSNLDRKEKKIDVNEDSNAVKNDDKTNSKTMATKVSACDKVMNRKTTNSNLDRKEKKIDVNEDSNAVKNDDKTNSKTMVTKVSACDKAKVKSPMKESSGKLKLK